MTPEQELISLRAQHEVFTRRVAGLVEQLAIAERTRLSLIADNERLELRLREARDEKAAAELDLWAAHKKLEQLERYQD